MAFPSLAEIQKKVAVKQETESAPANESTAPAPEPTANETVEGQTTEASPEAEAQPTPEPTQEQEAQPESGESEPDRIPYGRFKDKVDQVNTLKETNELLLKQLEALKQQPGEEIQPEPEPADPLLERLDSLDEYADSDMVSVMKDMAAELKTLRAQASTSEQSVNQMRVQERVQKIESEIEQVTGTIGVHDAKAARIFILQSLSQDPNLKVNDLADSFKSWEQQQEDLILKRLGMSRPAEKAPKQESEAPDTPPRPSHAGSSSPKELSEPKKGITLKELRKTIGAGRRR